LVQPTFNFLPSGKRTSTSGNGYPDSSLTNPYI
jgi:hypothetical protein